MLFNFMPSGFNRFFKLLYQTGLFRNCSLLSYRFFQLCIFGLLLYLLPSCQQKNKLPMDHINTYAFRLKPGQDLKQEIQKIVTQKQIKAGWISSCAGSLTNYNIRFANQPVGSSDTGHFEIVSLTGTVSTNGSHIHISISDSTGKTIGGHLMDGCIIYTTAEIVILSSNNFTFKREKDGTTAWEELQVDEK
jgi:uncharacterized protein